MLSCGFRVTWDHIEGVREPVGTGLGSVTFRLVHRFGCLLLGWLRLPARSSAAKDAGILVVLRHQLAVLQRGSPKPAFTRGDRAVLAALLRLLSRRHHSPLKLLVTPRTVLRWLARPVAKKRTCPHRGPGRPAKPEVLRALVLRLACENDGRGYRRIHGELLNPGWKIAASTVWKILQEAGTDPAPQRADRSWARFLKTQTRGIPAVGVFPVDTVLLRRLFVLFFVEHGARRVRVAGVTRHVTAAWATQCARNLLMSWDDTRGEGVRSLIRDNAGYFTEGFDAVFTAVGARVVPSCRACPGRTRSPSAGSDPAGARPPTASWSPGSGTCRLIVGEHADHHNGHRPHRSLGQECPDGLGASEPPAVDAPSRILRRDRLGDLIHEYAQVA
ncbi:integrase [Streptomyces sp. NPDC096105]|uniref:integrase n=1 Tax=Streptomyces sp. NPDC096105 TaxID=3366074 RepID=UPI0038198EF9